MNRSLSKSQTALFVTAISSSCSVAMRANALSSALTFEQEFVSMTNTPTTTQQMLANRLAQRTHALTVEAVRELRLRIPAYQALPAEAIRGDVTSAVRCNLNLIWSSLRTGLEPDPLAMAELTASAARRADERIPLSDVLRAYHIGAEQVWVAISSYVDDVDLLAHVTGVLHTHLRSATMAVLAGYGGEQAPPRNDQAAKRSLLAALVCGSEVDSTAARLGLSIAPSYLVLALHVEPHPDERSTGINKDVAACRKVRRMERELNRLGRNHTLCDLQADGGVALVPMSLDDVDGRAWIDTRLLAVEQAAGASVLAAIAWSARESVPVVLAETKEVLAVARRHGRHSEVITLDDIAVEYQLSRPSAAHRMLAETLRPIVGQDSVLETLAAYLDCWCDRNAAAARLHVHVNTVGYRLRKVTMLTGLDMAVPRDVMRATAALAAYRATSATVAQTQDSPTP